MTTPQQHVLRELDATGGDVRVHPDGTVEATWVDGPQERTIVKGLTEGRETFGSNEVDGWTSVEVDGVHVRLKRETSGTAGALHAIASYVQNGCPCGENQRPQGQRPQIRVERPELYESYPQLRTLAETDEALPGKLVRGAEYLAAVVPHSEAAPHAVMREALCKIGHLRGLLQVTSAIDTDAIDTDATADQSAA